MGWREDVDIMQKNFVPNGYILLLYSRMLPANSSTDCGIAEDVFVDLAFPCISHMRGPDKGK
jgi:hypothetical protein